ncbi:MAG: LegC family aminotransferase [Thermoanaerobaculia bacterium]
MPELRGNEWKYVKECLDTNFVSSVGPFVDRFERMMAETVSTAHAVATVNGTAALHVALRVAGVRPDDEVLVSTLSFIAPANAIRYLGAWPVFVDAESEHWQMDPALVEGFLREECRKESDGLWNRRTGRRVSALLPVHVLGHPVDMDPILESARRHGLVVVEDATESLGSRYKGRPTGSMGLLGCFSFNGNKILTTGGGGMITTDDRELACRAKYLTTQAKDDPIEYVHGEIGYNYRLTNVLAAIGCAQLEQIDAYVRRKREIAAAYDAAVRCLPGLSRLRRSDLVESNEWLYTVAVNEQRAGRSSRQLLEGLAARGIQSRPLWQPLHRSPAYAGACERIGGGVAETLNREGLSLPCSVGLTEAEQNRVLSALGDLLCTDLGRSGAAQRDCVL